jgi:hypothetical protein
MTCANGEEGSATAGLDKVWPLRFGNQLSEPTDQAQPAYVRFAAIRAFMETGSRYRACT